MTKYKQAKEELKQYSDYLHKEYADDKPAIRQGINDYADAISRHVNLSDSERNRLSDYCCKLHPK